ncbi:MAG TPA: peptide chain release factor N(5)-glutamine methyltransferase [Desulfobacteria bacterium]|nr:peptide chain release factor N(5)-glutamine methyltransferase [Desulfobacteria bacterium]
MVSFQEAISKGTVILRSRSIETARLDAEVLLAHVLDVSRTDLYLNIGSIDENKLSEYYQVVRRRADREPVAYLTGEREFMSLPFKVSSDVLIPRPETEIIVEKALEIKPFNIIDVGTGSGAIAVSLANYLPESSIRAVDISAGALEVAKYNAARHGVSDRITFYNGNLLDPFNSPEHYFRYDLITANLPYIPTPEMNELPYDVRGYEPVEALCGGEDGLELYRKLLPVAAKLLKQEGHTLIEFGYLQAAALREMLADCGFSRIEVIKDLAGLDRVIKAAKS